MRYFFSDYEVATQLMALRQGDSLPAGFASLPGARLPRVAP
jgi:hypothetical protein